MEEENQIEKGKKLTKGKMNALKRKHKTRENVSDEFQLSDRNNDNDDGACYGGR